MKNPDYKREIIRYYICGFIFVSVLGSLNHFIYDWTGQNKIVGLFTAVNESTWEHMKLLFFPMLLFSGFIKFKLNKEHPSALPSVLISALIGTGLIPVFFYTYTGILGFMIDAINIIIFYVCAIIAFITAYRFTIKYRFEEVNIILYFVITLFICMFFLFTYDPPNLGIFIDPTAMNNVMIYKHPAAW